MTALRISEISDLPMATPRAETPDCHLCDVFANASAAPRSPFAAGEHLFRQGDPVQLVYRVLKGAVVSRLSKETRVFITWACIEHCG